MKLPSSVNADVVFNDSWFLILKMNGYLAACFYKFHVLGKQKLIKTKQPDRPIRVGSWKSYEKRQLKIKVLYFKESFTFQSK